MLLDQGKAVLLVLLDLSAVFATVDHKLLTVQLASRLSISGVVLDWVICYLLNRAHFLSIGNARSETQNLLRSAPQGSLLSPIFFTIYTQSLGDIVRHHNMK